MDIDGTAATVAVETPHLMHQTCPGESPPGMLYKEIQQFELGQGQVQVFAVQRTGETARAKEGIAELQRAVDRAVPAAYRQPQSFQQFIRAGRGQHHIVEMPIDVNRRNASRRNYGHHRDGGSIGCHSAAERPRGGGVAVGIDDRNIGAIAVSVTVVGEGRAQYGMHKGSQPRQSRFEIVRIGEQ